MSCENTTLEVELDEAVARAKDEGCAKCIAVDLVAQAATVMIEDYGLEVAQAMFAHIANDIHAGMPFLGEGVTLN